MNPARISELLQPFLTQCHSEAARSGDEEPAFLSAAQIRSISTYIDILQRWNSRINLTAIRDEEQIVTRHFGESLFAACHLFPGPQACPERSSVPLANERVSLADIGSGAGFPGIPIKLWAPRIQLMLIESNHKKAAFLGEAARALTLTDIDIHSARAEALTRRFDLVTLRAVERFEAILPVAANLLAPSGQLALLVGSAQSDVARSILSKFRWPDPYPIPGSNRRVLLIGQASGS